MGAPIDKQFLRAAAARIRYWSGIDVPEYRLPVLQAELERLGDGTVEQGLERLERDAKARELVLRAVSIPESYLFRHPGHFVALRELALARRAASRPCHVLSAGCSTGEEAWSAAAVLASVFRKSPQPCSVTGWELDPVRVARARQGRLRAWSARGGFAGYDEFFVSAGEEWLVDQRLHALVQFHQVNLVRDPLAVERRFDVVLFRNVAMYWASELVHPVADRVTTLLAEDGLLMLGPSDPVVLDRDGWSQRIVGNACVYSRARRLTRRSADPPPTTAERAQARCHRSVTTSASCPRTTSVPRSDTVRALRSLPCATSRSAQTGHPYPTAREIERLADAGDYQAALALVRQSPSPRPPELLHWEGVLLLNLGMVERASSVFQQCVFLEPEQPVFRRWLAVTLEKLGRTEEAAREQRNAQDLEAT